MRILHLADLHLGKIFNEVHLTDDQSYLLDQVVTLAKDHKVNTVVITGDIPGVGFSRAEWNEIKELSQGQTTQRIITYLTPLRKMRP